MAALAVFAVAAGIAYATTTDTGAVYTACKLNATGTIRLIEPGASGLKGRCTSYETEISWNERGQDGAPGPVGPQGPQGPKGDDAVIGPESITTAEIRNGTITADDLAGGSVTTDKQKANAAISLVGSPNIVVPAVGLTGTDSSTSATITVVGGSHVVLVEGQAQLDVWGLAAGEVVTVAAQLFEGATPISPQYRDQLTATDPTLTLPVSALLPDGVVSAVSPGAHTYTLRLSASSLALAADRTVNVTGAQVKAIDLGRS